MRRLAAVGAVLALALPATALPPATADVARAADDWGMTVALDKDSASAGPGEELTFVSTIANNGAETRTDLVAHLNILTTDPDVYVDPEDWSPRRTQYVDALEPGEDTALTWDVQAVTSGPLILFVSVTTPSSDQVTSSGPLNLTVGGQRVVDAGQVLPLVVWMPGGVLALIAAVLVRRRRHR